MTLNMDLIFRANSPNPLSASSVQLGMKRGVTTGYTPCFVSLR